LFTTVNTDSFSVLKETKGIAAILEMIFSSRIRRLSIVCKMNLLI